MNHIKYLFILVCLIATSAKGNAQVVEKKTITLDGAMQIINVAKDYARKRIDSSEIYLKKNRCLI
ncbi:MAG: hypothetical protein WBD99_10590 [Thermodesulfobacteriota bacterium]